VTSRRNPQQDLLWFLQDRRILIQAMQDLPVSLQVMLLIILTYHKLAALALDMMHEVIQ